MEQQRLHRKSAPGFGFAKLLDDGSPLGVLIVAAYERLEQLREEEPDSPRIERIEIALRLMGREPEREPHMNLKSA